MLSTDCPNDGFNMLPPLTLTSFYTKDVTIKSARFLNVGILFLGQERTCSIEYTQCIRCRPLQLRKISRGFSSEWYVSFNSYRLMGCNGQAKPSACQHVSRCPKRYMNANPNEKPCLTDSFQCEPQMTLF